MKFSFVILTWNRYKFLEICLPALIESIADRNISEILIMDNGSTDRTGEVLEHYQGQNQIRIFTSKRNRGINAYKQLFDKSNGEYIVTIDDDVLEFPAGLDVIFSEYMETFSDFGYVALNVIQNELTNGAKPGPEFYADEVRDGKTMQIGPTGGWCSCFRQRDFARIRLRFKLFPLTMRLGEDGFIAWNFKRKLKLKSGIIKNAVCLHACGPLYAKQYDHLDREIAKYKKAGLGSIAQQYRNIQ